MPDDFIVSTAKVNPPTIIEPHLADDTDADFLAVDNAAVIETDKTESEVSNILENLNPANQQTVLSTQALAVVEEKTETVNAPAKEGSTDTSIKTAIAGFTVPAFLGVLIKSITDIISQGYVSAAQIGEFVLNIIKENQKYVLYIVIAIIGLLAVKKVCKQITLWIQMWFAGNKDTNNVEVKPQ